MRPIRVPELEAEPVVLLDEQVEMWIEKLKGLSDSRGISFEFHSKGEPKIMIRMRPDLFRIVLDRLFENSSEAMQECCEKNIRIEVKHLLDEIQVSFKDVGRGISKEVISQLSSRKYSTDGVRGWGLPMIHLIVEKYGGKVVIESPETGGTKVTLDFQQWI